MISWINCIALNGGGNATFLDWNCYRLLIIALMSFCYDATLIYLRSTQFPIYMVLNYMLNCMQTDTETVYYAMERFSTEVEPVHSLSVWC